MKSAVKILFYVVVNSEFPGLMDLAILLREQLNFQPIFYFNSFAHDLDKEIVVAKKNKFTVFICQDINEVTAHDSFLTRKGFLPGELKKETGFSVININQVKEKFESQITYFVSFLTDNKISAVVISSNNWSYGTPALIKAAHRCSLKVFSLPFGLGSPDTYARKLFYHSKRKTILDFMTGILFPKWKHIYQSRSLLPAPYFIIWVQELLGISPDNPWSSQGGDVDIILTGSLFKLNYYKNQGINPDKLLLTGRLENDKITIINEQKESHYRNFCSKRNLDSAKKMILVSLPPLMQSELTNEISEYSTQEEALVGFLEPLCKFADAWNIVISIHPRLKKTETIKCIPKNVVVDHLPLKTLIGMADVFINCQSSTCKMALSAGVPCLDYDFYRFNFPCFKEANALCRVDNQHDYIQILEYWLTEGELVNQQKEARLQADCFGINDGDCSSRIVQAFKKIRKEANMN